MKKYEYKTVEFEADDSKLSKSMHIDSTEIEQILNNLGEKGWELVNSIDYALNGFTRKVILFFKREKN